MGQPKAGLSLSSGEAIGQQTERLLSWLADEVLIAGHGHGFESQEGTRIFIDPPGTEGAMHALAQLPLPEDTDFVLVSACDQPGLDLSALRLLCARANVDTGAAFVDQSGARQPLPCCLPIELWKALIKAALRLRAKRSSKLWLPTWMSRNR